jgi:hypothetical protein
MLTDDGDKENKIGLGFVEMTLNHDTRNLIDRVLNPGLFLLFL